GKDICDPTCGSGRMLLAAAKINRRLNYYGADVDLTCCKMTVLNMLVNSLPGEIAWMNTLSNEHWKSWHIRLVRNAQNFYIPYYFTSGAGETNFIERLHKSRQEIKPLPDHRHKGPEVKDGHQFILF
ncbi:MAG TPA: N-6 DNA methylase, partial [Flavipsychrobacter sp.]|nr:N-6 DNA methylase [Flavipsychrobacter sp.]